MTTSLTAYAKGGNLQAIDKNAMAQALAMAGNEERSGSANTGVEYVSFSGKTGAITYGVNKDDLDQKEVFLLDPRSATRGWVCWKDNKPIARHQWSIYEPHKAVRQVDLDDKGPYSRTQDGWQSLLGFTFLSTEGETVQYEFSTNSKSGKNAVSDLFTEIGNRTAAGEANFPMFCFTREKFQAQGEWNFKPKFVIEEWLTEEEAADVMGVEAAEEAEVEEPQVEEVEEAEVVEEAPARRPRTRRA